MGHFIPMQNCATALKEAGHDVYIIMNGNDYIKGKAQGFEEKYGITMAYTECGLVNEDATRDPKGCEDPLNTFITNWMPFVRDTMMQIAPDIVVSDFISCPGIIIANELKIPVVINVPGPLRMFLEFGLFELPDMSQASNCCGLICMKKSVKNGCLQFLLPKLMKLSVPTFRQSQNSKIWMFNSYFGLDKPICIPPNIKMIGAINKDPTELMKLLQEKDMKLYQWLEDASASG